MGRGGGAGSARAAGASIWQGLARLESGGAGQGACGRRRSVGRALGHRGDELAASVLTEASNGEKIEAWRSAECLPEVKLLRQPPAVFPDRSCLVISQGVREDISHRSIWDIWNCCVRDVDGRDVGATCIELTETTRTTN